jgi:CRP-like cAMP-binding protein
VFEAPAPETEDHPGTDAEKEPGSPTLTEEPPPESELDATTVLTTPDVPGSAEDDDPTRLIDPGKTEPDKTAVTIPSDESQPLERTVLPVPERAPGDKAVRPETGEPLTVAELKENSLFSGLKALEQSRLAGMLVRRTFEAGQDIYQQGEYGSTAFLVLKGFADVYVATPGVEGSGDSPCAMVGENDFFGELTCLGLHPRPETVRAASDCVVFEMMRNALTALMAHEQTGARFAKAYRERGFDRNLKASSMFSDLSDEVVDVLRDGMALFSFEDGATIVSEGQAADALYLIRLGTVKVSRARGGRELALGFLGRGELLGVMGLLEGGLRTATCTAMNHVQLARIDKDGLHRMLQASEGLRERFKQLCESRRLAIRLAESEST